jgi:hypothetical protein
LKALSDSLRSRKDHNHTKMNDTVHNQENGKKETPKQRANKTANKQSKDRKKSKANNLDERRGIDMDVSDSSEDFEDSLDEIPKTKVPALPSTSAVIKEALAGSIDAINNIPDEATKTALLQMARIMINIVDDGSIVNEKVNQLIKSQNELITNNDDVLSSVNNLSEGMGKLGNSVGALENRMQTVETTQSCQFDCQFLNIILRDRLEAESVEKGTIWPRNKCLSVLDSMHIKYNKTEISDVSLLSDKRRVGGATKIVKYLKIRFTNNSSAGKVFGQIVKWNNMQKSEGRTEAKYMAETPVSRNVWKLKRICLELKKEGHIVNVHSNENGLSCIYKAGEANKRFKITSEKDIDALRRLQKVEDFHIPVSLKYGPDFWKAKFVSSNQKRGRESEGDTDSTQNLKNARVHQA